MPHCKKTRGKSPHSQENQLDKLAARVSSKLEEGDFRGAVRLACSEDSLVEPDADTREALSSKHPAPCRPAGQSPQPLLAPLHSNIQIEDTDVVKSIMSFPCGSAGGPDGLSPQHLKDLSSASAVDSGRMSLSSFVNFVKDQEIPPSIRPIFFGASLLALKKGWVC